MSFLLSPLFKDNVAVVTIYRHLFSKTCLSRLKEALIRKWIRKQPCEFKFNRPVLTLRYSFCIPFKYWKKNGQTSNQHLGYMYLFISVNYYSIITIAYLNKQWVLRICLIIISIHGGNIQNIFLHSMIIYTIELLYTIFTYVVMICTVCMSQRFFLLPVRIQEVKSLLNSSWERKKCNILCHSFTLYSTTIILF